MATVTSCDGAPSANPPADRVADPRDHDISARARTVEGWRSDGVVTPNLPPPRRQRAEEDDIPHGILYIGD
jgi:hypothetical protein